MDDPVPIRPGELEPGAPVGEALLLLNNAHATELSWLDTARLGHLARHAFAAWRVGTADAFLLAFDQAAEYDSPNFLWFRSRLARFVYVDRVVVAPACRGGGLARRMYERLFDVAIRAGHERIVCEVNSDPPNPGSAAFHARLGFVGMGSGALDDGRKTVRYLSRPLGSP